MASSLTRDPHEIADEPEFASIKTAELHDVQRALQAVRAISRITCNNAGEPDASGGTPLAPAVVAELLGGAECLSNFAACIVQGALQRAVDRACASGDSPSDPV